MRQEDDHRYRTGIDFKKKLSWPILWYTYFQKVDKRDSSNKDNY
jgi:hypothetical protein